MKRKQPFIITEEQVNFKLPRELKKRLEDYAAKRKMNVSMLIRTVLDEKITEEEKQSKKTA